MPLIKDLETPDGVHDGQYLVAYDPSRPLGRREVKIPLGGAAAATLHSWLAEGGGTNAVLATEASFVAAFTAFMQTTAGRAAFATFFAQWMANLPTDPAVAGTGKAYNAGGIPAVVSS